MTTRQRWTLICTVIGSGAVFLDGTIVNAALKHIGQELPATLIGVLEGQAYIVGGYLAVLAALLILSGALSRPSWGWSSWSGRISIVQPAAWACILSMRY